MSGTHWDERYSAYPDYFYGYRPNDFLVQQAKLLRPNSKVLCLGDGEGRNGVWLAQQGHRVTSVDLSAVGLERAQQLAAERKVEITTIQADLAEWVFTEAAAGPWDALVSIFVHMPPAVRKRVAEGLTPRMQPKGWLLLEAYTPGQLALGTGGPKDESMLLTRERVLSDWPGWHLDVRLVERRIFEGRGHQGLSSVVQVLGQAPTG